MTNFLTSRVGLAATGLAAIAFVAMGTARPAYAAGISVANYSASLDDNNGGPVDLAGPDLLGGTLAYTGGVLSLSDGQNPTFISNTSAHSSNFTFNYYFTVSSSLPTYTYVVQSDAINSLALTLTGPGGPLVGVSGSGPTAGNLVLSTSNLVANTLYDLIVSGSIGAGQSQASFSGAVQAVSPVPLPGALTLFGAGLVGLAAFGRRRRRKTAAAVATVAALAAPVLISSQAEAASITYETASLGAIPAVAGTVNPGGVVNGLTGGTGIMLHAKETAGKVITSNGNYTGESPVFGVSGLSFIPAGASTATPGSQTITVEDFYTFSLTAESDIYINLSAGNTPALTSLIPADFVLYNSSNAVVGTSVLKAGALQIAVANVAAGSYYFKVVLPLTASTSATATGTISAVPLPGALLLFGASLAGLGAIASRKVKKTI